MKSMPERAQWVKMLSAKPNSLRLILGTHLVEEDTNSCELSFDHMCAVAPECVHM